MSVSAQHVIAAVHALHTGQQQQQSPQQGPPKDPRAVRAHADRWLVKFQDTQEAWTIAHTILQTPNLSHNVYYYAASTLRHKLTYDFQDLPNAQARLAFRNAVMQHLARFVNGPKVVSERLALVMALVTVHLLALDEWDDAMPQLTRELGANPQSALILLYILTAVPEECGNRRVGLMPAHRHNARRTLTAFTPTALQMLLSFLQQTGSDRELQQKVLTCLAAWVKFSDMDMNVFAEHALFAAVFQAIAIPDLLYVACDVIIGVIHRSEDVRKHLTLALDVILRILALRPLYHSVLLAVQGSTEAGAAGAASSPINTNKSSSNNNNSGAATRGPELAGDVSVLDEAHLRKLGRVFIDAGETYLVLIAEGSPEAVSLASFIAKIAYHPSCLKISTDTLNFWYLLSSRLKYRDANGQEVVEPSYQRFVPVFLELVPSVKAIMTLPTEWEQWDLNDKAHDSERDEIKGARYAAAETLQDCTSIIGTEGMLSQIYEYLQQEWVIFSKDTHRWNGLEAALYMMRSIARKVPQDEGKVMPRLMELLSGLAQNRSLRYTATLIVGRYSYWVSRHPEHLASLLTFVVEGLNDTSTRASASVSFKRVCLGCARWLAHQSYFESVLLVYAASHQLPQIQQIEIVEGLMCVISALGESDMIGAVKRIMLPIIGAIQSGAPGAAAAAVGSANGSAAESPHGGVAAPVGGGQAPTVMVNAVERLAYVFGSFKTDLNADPSVVERCIVLALREVWPLLAQLMGNFPREVQVLEYACRCIQRMLKIARTKAVPMLSDIVALMGEGFSRHPNSCYVYTLCVIVDSLAAEPGASDLLATYHAQFTPPLLQILDAPIKFEQMPDLGEDFFALQKRFITHASTRDQFYASPLLVPVFRCVAAGLLVQHRECSFALTQFASMCFTFGIDSRRANAARLGNRPNGAHVASLRTVLEQVGQPLVQSLMQAVYGAVPSANLGYMATLVELLIQFDASVMRMLITGALERMPETERPTKHSFVTGMFSNPDPRNVRDAVYALNEAAIRLERQVRARAVVTGEGS